MLLRRIGFGSMANRALMLHSASPLAQCTAASSTIAIARRFQSGGDESENKLLEEIMMLTSTPIPIGALFKSLSQESRQTLMRKKLPVETFLLRHKDTFSVYKNADKGQIMASRVSDVPISAMRGVEATTDQMFTGKAQDANLHAVYTVLKYIPNEWSPFVSLGIPEEIRTKFMNKKPKTFFESHPKYFEVKAQALRAHTFEVRRSLALQQATEAQQQQQQPPPE
eukprot:GILI01024290.1.p1 GENE.GILI01024290.1~~GILI01024290.1.p1  ORF type:complete len:225 (-),score=47.82 GILI01024290.1:216-890(-)